MAIAKPTVLIVDDDINTVSMLNDTLDEAGFTVLVALEGNQALSITSQITPDIILLDAVMPHLDGFGLLNLIRGDLKLADVPMVLMTSHIDVDVQVGPKTGVDGFLPKPFEPQDILEQVRFVLNE